MAGLKKGAVIDTKDKHEVESWVENYRDLLMRVNFVTQSFLCKVTFNSKKKCPKSCNHRWNKKGVIQNSFNLNEFVKKGFLPLLYTRIECVAEPFTHSLANT